MSDTPRTDSWEEKNSSTLRAGYNDWPDYARQLERELAAVTAAKNKALEALKTLNLDVGDDSVDKLIAEL